MRSDLNSISSVLVILSRKKVSPRATAIPLCWGLNFPPRWAVVRNYSIEVSFKAPDLDLHAAHGPQMKA